jgi:hypothetical protein
MSYIFIAMFFTLLKNIIGSCSHDDLVNGLKDRFEENYGVRNLQAFGQVSNNLVLKNNSDLFKPIRIKFLYINSTNINRTFFTGSYLNVTETNSSVIKTFEQDFLKPVKQLLQSIIKVYPYMNRIYLDDKSCAYTEPKEHVLGIPNFDLILAYTFEYSDLNYRARSHPCNLGRSIYNRPVTGMTYINIKYLDPDRIISPEEKKLIQLTMLHEYIHILGFTPFLYNMFIDDFGNRYDMYDNINFMGIDAPILSSTRLTNYTREYFNCSKVPGMILEKNGVNGTSYSHWSRTLIQNELMTGSSAYNYRIITNFTLKLLDDTGWYKIDYSHAEKTLWGKNKGCQFFKSNCDEFAEYCKEHQKLGCDYDYKFLATCTSDGLSSCPYNYGFQNCSNIFNLNENNRQVTINLEKNYPYNVFTDLSRCVISSYKDLEYIPRCQRVTCDSVYKNVIIYLDDTDSKSIRSVTCQSSDANKQKSLLDYKGNNITFICPYYTRMCYEVDNDIIGAYDIISEDSYISIGISLIMFVILIIN